MDDRTKQLLTLGREHYEKREFDKAEHYLKQVLERGSAYADVYNMLGVISHDHGQFEEAQKFFEEALSINPNYTEAALNLAVTYNDLGASLGMGYRFEHQVAAFHCGLLLGYGAARMLRFEPAICRTIALEVGMQNSGLATALALKFFSPAAALPGAIFSVWLNITGSIFASLSTRSAGFLRGSGEN